MRQKISTGFAVLVGAVGVLLALIVALLQSGS